MEKSKNPSNPVNKNDSWRNHSIYCLLEISDFESKRSLKLRINIEMRFDIAAGVNGHKLSRKIAYIP
jgi:hypothetical protein